MDPGTAFTASGSFCGGAVASLQAVGVYQFLGSLLSGRRTLELWPLLVDGRLRLEQAGAIPLIAEPTDEPPLALEDGSVEAVLCLTGLAERHDPQGRSRWLAEICRVLVPEGLCVIRLPSSAGQTPHEELRHMLSGPFARTDTVAEAPFVGVSFFVSGTEEMALGGDLQQLASSPSHELLFCMRAAGTWPITESLFIPLEGLRAEVTRCQAWQAAVDSERDELREALFRLQEQVDRQDAALVTFRRRHARSLERTSEGEALIEALALEREQLEQRAREAEKALTELEVESRRRQVELLTLEREIVRLHARQAPRPDQPPGKNDTPPPLPAAHQGEPEGEHRKGKPPA
jgi:hypothetical protein